MRDLQGKTEQKIRMFLEANEKYIASVAGYQIHKKTEQSLSLLRITPLKMDKMYTVGLTNKNLIIYAENSFGKKIHLERIPINQRVGAKLTPYSKGDRLTIFWSNNHLDLHVIKHFRQDAQILADVFGATEEKQDFEAKIQHQSHSPLSSIHENGRVNTRIQILIWAAAGLAELFLGTKLSSLLYPSNPPEYLSNIILALGFIIFGMIGVTIIKRKELPWLFVLKGKVAVVLGSLIVIFSWGLALLTLVRSS